jgi:hypothetical protein
MRKIYQKSPQDQLDELTATILAALDAAQEARCHAWHNIFSAGDALLSAQEHVSTNWKQWLREHCSLSVRTAFRYMQLARHRAEIEAAIKENGELSLRAALQLIAEPHGTKGPKAKKLNLLLAWNSATAEEKALLFDTVGMVNFLRVISFAFRRELESRLRKRGTENPDFHLTCSIPECERVTMVVDQVVAHGGGNREPAQSAQPATEFCVQLPAADFSPAFKLIPVSPSAATGPA